MKHTLLLLIVACMCASCSSSSKVLKSTKYAQIYEQKPISIMVMPPINRSTKVEAKELFYSSLIVPLSQQGYYILPPVLTMEILKQESAYDAEMFINNSMKDVGEMFGADAILFTTIHTWSKSTITAQIRVVVEYTLKSTKTDEIIFNRKGDITYNPSANSSNMLANLVSNILTTAFTKEVEVGRKCNVFTLSDIPAGKYSPNYGADGAASSGESEFSITIR